MVTSLNRRVEIVADSPCVELRDTRTGFHIAVEVGLPALNQLSEEAAELLGDLGFVGDLPLEEVRRRQRPWRDRLQAELRNEELLGMLEFALKNVPYYRNRPRIYDGSKVACVGDLLAYPLLHKSHLRRWFQDLISDQVDVSQGLLTGALSLTHTSGTTDERIQVLSDMSLDRVPPAYETLWGLCFNEETPKTAVLTTPLCTAAECRLGRSSIEERIRYGNTLYLNSTEDLFQTPDAAIRNFCDEMNEYRPNFLVANPTYLHWFARRAAELGLKTHSPDVILSTYQYLSKLQRRAIESFFSSKVYNIYTATELAGSQVGVECRYGNLHIREDHSILEVVEDDILSLPSVGALIITTVSNRLMPLIRYDIGDIGSVKANDCPCELSDWTCLELHGRVKDVLHLGGRVVTTKTVDDIISDVLGVDFYKCIQVGETALHVMVITSVETSFDSNHLAERLREGTGAKDVFVQCVSRLDPEHSMKFRLTVPLHERTSLSDS